MSEIWLLSPYNVPPYGSRCDWKVSDPREFLSPSFVSWPPFSPRPRYVVPPSHWSRFESVRSQGISVSFLWLLSPTMSSIHSPLMGPDEIGKCQFPGNFWVLPLAPGPPINPDPGMMYSLHPLLMDLGETEKCQIPDSFWVPPLTPGPPFHPGTSVMYSLQPHFMAPGETGVRFPWNFWVLFFGSWTPFLTQAHIQCISCILSPLFLPRGTLYPLCLASGGCNRCVVCVGVYAFPCWFWGPIIRTLLPS